MAKKWAGIIVKYAKRLEKASDEEWKAIVDEIDESGVELYLRDAWHKPFEHTSHMEFMIVLEQQNDIPIVRLVGECFKGNSTSADLEWRHDSDGWQRFGPNQDEINAFYSYADCFALEEV